MREKIKEIKNQFYSFRNGIVADSLRKGGLPYKVIFGLQLPQITALSRNYEPDFELASELWNDKEVRESRLLACHLFPKDKINLEQALELASSVSTTEEADILCFRLLRFLPFAEEITERINQDFNPDLSSQALYCGEMLKKNLERMRG